MPTPLIYIVVPCQHAPFIYIVMPCQHLLFTFWCHANTFYLHCDAMPIPFIYIVMPYQHLYLHCDAMPTPFILISNKLNLHIYIDHPLIRFMGGRRIPQKQFFFHEFCTIFIYKSVKINCFPEKHFLKIFFKN